MLGRVPLDATDIICFMCYNPNEGEQDKDTNWKDRRGNNDRTRDANKIHKR